MKHKCFCEVVVNNKTKMTDKLFTYRIPKKFLEKVKIGSKVIVPFGKGNKLIEGYVFNILDNTNLNKLKEIKYVLNDVSLTEKQIDLCKWIRDNYLCTYYEAIQCLVPTGTTLNKRKTYNLNIDAYKNCKKNGKFSKEQITILNILEEKDRITIKELNKIMGFDCNKIIKGLINKNLIIEEEEFFQEVKTKYKKIVKINIDNKKVDEVIIKLSKKAYRQAEVLRYLSVEADEIELNKLLAELNVSLSVIKSLFKKGLIKIKEVEDFRNPIEDKNIIKEKLKILNKEQALIYNEVVESLKYNKNDTFLLHGVTGSGKTEIYIKLVEYVLNDNKQAIILVPEISLTTQIVNKFISRFGKRVAILHSKLSLGERYDQWKKIKNMEIPIVIGARSAIFAPCNNLGLVIIDEEHESSYKSEMNPKYHTIEVAKYRCKHEKAVLLLGSATPSIESYYKAKCNEYRLLELKKRFNKNPLPLVEIVDMRKELENGNKNILSRKLYSYMKKSLLSKGQVILFLNRRGYSTFVSCRSCGYILKCHNCDISLTYHKNSNIAKCHYCGSVRNVPNICPVCNSKYIKYFGTGTEKVETLVKKMFPSFVTKRLDVDTTSKKGEMEEIISAFEKRKIDILIGTQMVAKGLDFPHVTLVGVISADITLNIPDYRSNERTFQLLTQVAGRAGRHNYKGRVIVQTYSPNNFVIKLSQNHDYFNFYKNELSLRKEFLYPPFCNLVSIIIYGQDELLVKKTANRLSQKLKEKIDTICNISKEIQILGPNPAVYNKIKGNYRWQIIIKYKTVDHENIKGIIYNICYYDKNIINNKNVYISFDFNPYTIL